MNTGHNLPGRPSLGSWLSYGLGSEADDLPAFVVLTGPGNLSGGAAMWGSGVLPGSHQGVPFRSTGDPILHVAAPPGVDRRAQRDSLDLIAELNGLHKESAGDPEIDVRVDAYEMAFRMQSAAPELTDLSGETAETFELYGADPADGKKQFANNCLLARRMAERGVRCVQVYHEGWDHHSDVKGGIEKHGRSSGRPGQCRAHQRPETAGAVGRHVGHLGRGVRPHARWWRPAPRTRPRRRPGPPTRGVIRCCSPAAAIKPGLTYGETDDLGFSVTKDPVPVRDLHATVLHCLGRGPPQISGERRRPEREVDRRGGGPRRRRPAGVSGSPPPTRRRPGRLRA